MKINNKHKTLKFQKIKIPQKKNRKEKRQILKKKTKFKLINKIMVKILKVN